MNGAALCGHLDVVQWLHENRSEGCTVHAMDSAVRNRDWAMVQWLHTNRSEGCSRGAMDWAAAAGNLSLVRWLHTHRSEGCTTRAMDWAAAAGHLETVQWLHNNRIEGGAGRALRTAASSGHLDVVQWLHATRGMEQSGDMDSLAALEIAEMHNHRVVADWLQAHLKSSECELGHQATFQANPPEQARCHLMWEYPVLYVRTGTPTTATSSTAAARGTRVMDDQLRAWALYDISGARAPDTLDTMKDHFRRFGRLRQ
ncbi:uncharacterized protein PITG_08222 [Phytophthora infestans T30-4]|uniref:Ankyrin repeat protein n=1 Tax=Phytophthora infestans (strain T30-4) TaxID=403677 RepID=D0N9S0_PHYIT|nr:uncharacterized protein PITG_08222 [Phytophthora infestans T30-4]EEY54558.1 conserved hypothetical protein [Phytophthora infestans T30-4]|eukprot:XP_002904380.1 conserved hypothetical protein [Phytophthora infestans T30-4]